jgi:hypothetical protein
MRTAEDDVTYLRRVETLARAVCDRAHADGWLCFGPDPDEATALQRAVNELARNLRHHYTPDDGCCP